MGDNWRCSAQLELSRCSESVDGGTSLFCVATRFLVLFAQSEGCWEGAPAPRTAEAASTAVITFCTVAGYYVRCITSMETLPRRKPFTLRARP